MAYRLSDDYAPETPPATPAGSSDGRLEYLVQNITSLSSYELEELADLISTRLSLGQTGSDFSTSELKSLATFATLVKTEVGRRQNGGAITASAGPLVPADRRPNRVSTGTATAITASGGDLFDGNALGREISDVMKRSASDPRTGRTSVATLHVQRSADRTLSSQDHIATGAAIDAAAAQHAQHVATQLASPQALVAAGGLGTPEAVDYSLVGFKVADRPVRDALPGFTATRGGVRFVRPPTLADLGGVDRHLDRGERRRCRHRPGRA